jgi:endoglucanase
MHALACDDLAATAAALAAMDVLLGLHATDPASVGDVRLLFTRAEEIGFVGAIAACRSGTMPMDARVIALENSRSFPESPIGGGPIVRVGDRLSVFSPALTEAVARRAEEIAGGPASVTASQKLADAPAWKWQRKLMAGGACEASVFCASGREATCVCLPLGNYHNMADLAAVQAGTNSARPRVAREFISIADYEGLVDLLVACGRRLPASAPLRERFERLWAERSFVLA